MAPLFKIGYDIKKGGIKDGDDIKSKKYTEIL